MVTLKTIICASRLSYNIHILLEAKADFKIAFLVKTSIRKTNLEKHNLDY